MSLLHLPIGVLLQIADSLDWKDLSHLIQASHHFANHLTPVLHRDALLDKDGMPALFWAALKGHEALAAFLIERGVNVNHRLPGDYNEEPTALHVAARNSRAAVIRLLVAKGADLEARSRYQQMTPLWLAFRSEDGAIARLLVELGADVDAQDDFGTLLHKYSHEGDMDRIKLLLELGADVHAKTNTGSFLLHECFKCHQSRIAGVWELLVQHGADINAQETDTGNSILHWATNYGGSFELCRAVLQKGANVNLRNLKGYSPLDFALRHGVREETVGLLIDRGADTTIQCPASGDTALHVAIQNFYEPIIGFQGTDALEEIVKPLLQAPLEEIVKHILRNPAGIDIQNNDGETPLHSAVRGAKNDCSTTIIRLLLEKGANREIRDKAGQKVVDLPTTREDIAVAKLFKAFPPPKPQEIAALIPAPRKRWQARPKLWARKSGTFCFGK